MELKVINCNHWEECGLKYAGCCKINEYVLPSYDICLKKCDKNTSLIVDEGLTPLQKQVAEMDTSDEIKMKEFCKSLDSNPVVLVIDTTKMEEDIYTKCASLIYNGFIYVETLSKCWAEQVRDLKLSTPKKQGVTWENLKSITSAVLVGKQISKERQEERLKTCHGCELFRWNEVDQEAKCGVCGCKLSGRSTKLLDLTSYEETEQYGCKHPRGSKWKENGV